ncbi:MAG: hypothetical protein FWJ93_11530, partial [Micromonosporaceae bacterium]
MGKRWLSRLGVAIAAAGALTLSTATAAWATKAPEPTEKGGNVTTCVKAGLSGDKLFGADKAKGASNKAGSGTVSRDKKTLDVTINDGYTASGIVVKGGNGYHVYQGPFEGPTTIEGMVSPKNKGGKIPEISHWFVCGDKSEEPG